MYKYVCLMYATRSIPIYIENDNSIGNVNIKQIIVRMYILL